MKRCQRHRATRGKTRQKQNRPGGAEESTTKTNLNKPLTKHPHTTPRELVPWDSQPYNSLHDTPNPIADLRPLHQPNHHHDQNHIHRKTPNHPTHRRPHLRLRLSNTPPRRLPTNHPKSRRTRIRRPHLRRPTIQLGTQLRRMGRQTPRRRIPPVHIRLAQPLHHRPQTLRIILGQHPRRLGRRNRRPPQSPRPLHDQLVHLALPLRTKQQNTIHQLKGPRTLLHKTTSRTTNLQLPRNPRTLRPKSNLRRPKNRKQKGRNARRTPPPHGRLVRPILGQNTRKQQRKKTQPRQPTPRNLPRTSRQSMLKQRRHSHGPLHRKRHNRHRRKMARQKLRRLRTQPKHREIRLGTNHQSRTSKTIHTSTPTTKHRHLRTTNKETSSPPQTQSKRNHTNRTTTRNLHTQPTPLHKPDERITATHQTTPAPEALGWPR